jgi:hypothetical protein
MPDYRYELRRGDDVIATGHFSREQPLEIGERITIGSRSGIVRDVGPILGELELRLVVQAPRASSRTSFGGGARSRRVRNGQAAFAIEPSENYSVLVCAECGRTDDGKAAGWRGYRDDLPDEDEPSLAFFCPLCAAREFDEPSSELSRAR